MVEGFEPSISTYQYHQCPIVPRHVAISREYAGAPAFLEVDLRTQAPLALCICFCPFCGVELAAAPFDEPWPRRGQERKATMGPNSTAETSTEPSDVDQGDETPDVAEALKGFTRNDLRDTLIALRARLVEHPMGTQEQLCARVSALSLALCAMELDRIAAALEGEHATDVLG